MYKMGLVVLAGIMSIQNAVAQQFQVDYSVKGVVHDTEVKSFHTRHECRAYAYSQALSKGPQWRGVCYPQKVRKTPEKRRRVPVGELRVGGTG